MNRQARYALLLAATLSLALTGRAHAYLDPGTGSILLQMLIGGVVGGFFVLKMQWARVKSWLSSKSGGAQGEPRE